MSMSSIDNSEQREIAGKLLSVHYCFFSHARDRLLFGHEIQGTPFLAYAIALLRHQIVECGSVIPVDGSLSINILKLIFRKSKVVRDGCVDDAYAPTTSAPSRTYGRIGDSTELIAIFHEDSQSCFTTSSENNERQPSFTSRFLELFICNEEHNPVLEAARHIEEHCMASIDISWANTIPTSSIRNRSRRSCNQQTGVIVHGDVGCGKTTFLQAIAIATQSIAHRSISIIVDCTIFQYR